MQRERTGLTAPSDRKAQWGPPVLLVPSVRRERMELMARSDLRVQWDLSVLLVPPVQLARRERTELMARLVRKV